MKDISSLNKKLVGYSAMAGAMIAANHRSADAQVIHHDIDPDFILAWPNTEYFLDMNNDSITDFKISNDPYGNGGYGVIIPWGPNVYCMVNQTPDNYVAALASCEEISAIPPGNYYWSSSYPVLLWQWNGNSGSPWDNAIDKFVAVILHLNNGNHYAWIRMTHHENQDSIFIEDYAYEAIPDSAIITPCAQQVKNIEALNLFNASIENHQLILHFNQSIIPSQMNLLNEVGVKLREQTITNSELVLDVSQLAAGIYFVVVDDNEKRQVKKVVIE